MIGERCVCCNVCVEVRRQPVESVPSHLHFQGSDAGLRLAQSERCLLNHLAGSWVLVFRFLLFRNNLAFRTWLSSLYVGQTILKLVAVLLPQLMTI